MKKVAFIVQLPRRVSPGQRYRFEIWEPLLNQYNYSIDTFSFLDSKTYTVLYQKGHYIQKIAGVLRGILNRISFLFIAKRYDLIIMQREAAFIGPPVFEWILMRLLSIRVVYDFDDAIWIPNSSDGSKFIQWLKSFWKIKWLCKWSYVIIVGNNYLFDFAKKYNYNVVKIPTCVDTTFHHNRLKEHSQKDVITIGWTGSHSTMKYIDLIIPALEVISKQYKISLLIISNKTPQLNTSLHIEYVEWDEVNEVNALLNADIGIMPLYEDAWSKGKCGFKLLQYLALGIPAVASPVGVNTEIIQNGITGFIANDSQDWIRYIKLLIEDLELRKSMSINGTKFIIDNYSIAAWGDTYIKTVASASNTRR